jgi:hypothetical protein
VSWRHTCVRGSRRDTTVFVSSVYTPVFVLKEIARTNVVSIVLFVEVALVIVAQELCIAPYSVCF